MTPFIMQNHVCPNVRAKNKVLDGLYRNHQSYNIVTDHSPMAGALYNIVRSHQQFLSETVAEDPNVLWSMLTLLTYYLIRFAKREVEDHIARHENLKSVKAPEPLMKLWYTMVGQLGQRLGRPVCWYDLLFANNFEAEADNEVKVNPLLTVCQGADINEVNFIRAMIIIGGYKTPERIRQSFENYKSEHYLDMQFFNVYYVNCFNLLGRIRGLDGGQLNTISCMFPVGELNDHFNIHSPQESRLFQASVPS